MIPITGPFTRTQQFTGTTGQNLGAFRPVVYRKTSTFYRQRKPYDLPLAFTMDCKQCLSYQAINIGGMDYRDVDSGPSYLKTSGIYFSAALNQAYEKLSGGLGDSSMWAVNGIEWSRSVKLIVEPVEILTKFCKQLNRFDFPGAARTLRTHVPKGLKKSAKAFGNNFLKFHFGWEPLIKDIGAAVDTLQRPIRPIKLVGKGNSQEDETSGNGFPLNKTRWKYRVRMQAEALVTNPNLFRANQLGFVNPASVLWEVVKFSFVVDWFANVGQFLASASDFAGVSLSKQATTYYVTSTTLQTWVNGTTNRIVTYSGAHVKRELVVSGPTLSVRPWKGVSVVRAATAVSLLLQQLR